MKKIFIIWLLFFVPGMCRHIHAQTRIVTTLAGWYGFGYSPDGAPAATGNYKAGIAGSGYDVYSITCDGAGHPCFADNGNFRIRRINSAGLLETVAGNGSRGYSGDGGPATAARLSWYIEALGEDGRGNIYVYDSARIRKINTAGIITLVAGSGGAYGGTGGPATAAGIGGGGVGSNMAVDTAGNIYIGDGIMIGGVPYEGIRKITTAGYIVQYAGLTARGFGGDGGPATAAAFNNAQQLTADRLGNLYVADGGNNRIRKIDAAGIITTFAGNGTIGHSGDGGPATAARITISGGLAVDRYNNLYIAADVYIRKIDTAGIITTIAGNGSHYYYVYDGIAATASPMPGGTPLALDDTGNIYLMGNVVHRIGNNRAPHFVYRPGHRDTVCSGNTDSLNAWLAVVDSDQGQSELLSLASNPLHGTASIVDTFVPNVVTHVGTPARRLYYTSTAGYVGMDSFKVRVTDLYAADTITIYVQADSPVAPITGTPEVCAGTTRALADASTPGVWAATSAAVILIGSSTGIMYGTAIGVTDITYTAHLACGISAATITVTVDASPSPPVITGALAICAGAASSVYDFTTSGTWSCGSPLIATVGSASGIITGVATGVAQISYTLSDGCAATTPITINTSPAPITGITAACVGMSTALANAVSGGVWTSGPTAIATVGSATGIVNGITTGAAVITYTLSSGCPAMTTVNVNPAPTPVTGGSPLCPGEQAYLYDGTGGGTWISRDTTTAGVDMFGTVTGTAAGSSWVVYQMGAGCGDSTLITVHSVPAAISGSTAVCYGATTTLSDATPGGTWSSSASGVASVSTTGVVSGSSYGTALIDYTNSSGCAASITVTVSSGPSAITGAHGICLGAVTTLHNTVPGGLWTSSAPGIASIGSASGVVSGAALGPAVITYSLGAGCVVTFPVTVNQIPSIITGPNVVCRGATITLSDTVTGGIWNSGSAAIASINSSTATVTGNSAGIAIITYSLASGCSTTTTVSVIASPVISGQLAVCPASSAVLSAGSGSGTWSSSNTSIATVGSATGTLTGVASGGSIATVTITFTSATTGCSASVVATVNPAPAAIAGPGSVCTGSSISLSSSPGGGSWTRSNANINVSGTGLTIGVSAGTGTVTYTIPTTGCYATKNITVSTTPAAIVGAGSVCAGGSTTLTMTTNGGTWSSSNTTAATVSGSAGLTISVTGMSAGAATISYAMSTGCAANVTVTVNALPAVFSVTGGGGICPGGSGLHLGLSGSATGTTYVLYRGGTPAGTTLSGTGSSIDFGPQTTGTYTVMGSSVGGCNNTMTGSVTVSLNPTPVISGPSAVCAGATATLSATPGGMWASSNPAAGSINSATGVLTGVAIGSTVITCTSGSGCMATTTVNVTSAPSAIAGAGSVCAGANTILTSTPSGGVWTSSNILKASVGSLNGVVTGVATGGAVITYSLGGGCNAMTTINVLASPAAITGIMSLCAGNTTTLSSTTAGGAWSSTGTATVGGGSGTLTVTIIGSTAGTATVSYTAGGCSAIAVVTVNAVPPAISGATSLCQGATTSETNTISGGVWSTASAGIGITGAGTTATVTGTSAGVAGITYSVDGCGTTKNITVNTAPAISGARSVCTGGTSALSVSAGSGSGVWSTVTTAVATVTAGGVVSGVGAGTAAITFTPPTGCIATTTVTVNSTPGPITGPANVCAGSSTGYTASVAGTWTSSSPSVATIGATSGILTAVAPGVVTISCPPTGCSSSLTITVNALPAAIVGTNTLCVGTTTALSSTTAGGVWNNGGSSAASVGSSTGAVNGLAAGTASISYTVNGCSVMKAMTVNAIPSISGPNSVCLSSTVTLTPGTAGGVWSSSNPVVASVGSATGVVTGATLGAVTISYSLGPGCTMTAPMRVDSLPLAITGGSNICAGSTTALHDLTPGGVWSSGTAFASVNSTTGVVTGISGGAAIISYAGTNGCAITSSVTVIQLLPLAGIHPLCAWGDTMTVSSRDTTGIYTSTYATVLNVGHGRGIVTSTVPLTSTITYTIPAGCSITTTITVNPIPAGIAGVLDLCPGGSSTLTNIMSGGTWTSAIPAVAAIGASSGVVAASAAGTTSIVYTLPTGCKTDTVLTVTAPPVAGTISGRTNLCVGGTTLLTAGTGGVWSSGVTAVATISSGGVVTGVAPGVATVVYTQTNICGTAAAQATVNVYPAVNAGAITGADTICTGNATTLADTASGGAWTSTNIGIATVNSVGEVLGMLAGVDTIMYTVANPGCSATAIHSMTVLPHAVCALETSPQPSPKEREVLRSVLRIWPNPNDGTFSVLVVSATDEDVRVVVSDVTGRVVYSFSATTNKTANISLRVAAGVYFISAKNGTSIFYGKVEVK